jgi:hypothetical protein
MISFTSGDSSSAEIWVGAPPLFFQSQVFLAVHGVDAAKLSVVGQPLNADRVPHYPLSICIRSLYISDIFVLPTHIVSASVMTRSRAKAAAVLAVEEEANGLQPVAEDVVEAKADVVSRAAVSGAGDHGAIGQHRYC